MSVVVGAKAAADSEERIEPQFAKRITVETRR
jgi:hypothetical protein